MKFDEVKNRVYNIMMDHVGEYNFILSDDLFEKVYEKSPEEFEIFEKIFRWEVILRANSRLRLDAEMFIITRYNKSFVLQSFDEMLSYHKLLSSRKKALNKLEDTSAEWVRKKRWKKMKKKKIEVAMIQ